MLLHPRFNEFFKLSEFDSPDIPNSGKMYMDSSFLYLLTEARIIAGIPFKINSGFRSISRNQKVGGTKDSSHTKGYAVDIRTNSSEERFKIIDAALKVGITRIGIGERFVHLDNDPTKPKNVIWDYYDK